MTRRPTPVRLPPPNVRPERARRAKRPLLRLAAGAFLASVTLSSVASFSAGITGPSKGDPVAGKKIYKDKCVACHKADGSGGVKVTGNPTPDFRDPKRMNDPKFDDDYLRECITNGRPKSGMVAWSKQGVKPAQIENLIAYIRTFSAEKKAPEKK